MQNDTLTGSVHAAVTLGAKARRLAATLHHHAPGIADHQRRGAVHRLAVVLYDCGLAIGNAEAALSPIARNAIAELG